MMRPVALKSKLITMAKRVALQLWPVDTEPKARRTVKAAWSFSTVGRQRGGVTCASSSPRIMGRTETTSVTRVWCLGFS